MIIKLLEDLGGKKTAGKILDVTNDYGRELIKAGKAEAHTAPATGSGGHPLDFLIEKKEEEKPKRKRKARTTKKKK